MQRVLVLTVALYFGEAASVQVGAQTWCSTAQPNSVACEDFDSYDTLPFNSAWFVTGPCASSLSLDDGYTSSPPYAGKMNAQESGDLGYSRHAIPNEVRNHFGPGCTSGGVTGTDLNPLVLELVMNGQTDKAKFDNSFFTLATGQAKAPTDFAYSDWCGSSCNAFKQRFPIICQQESPPADCPSIASAPAVQAIAVGFLTYLDTNPCHCGETGPQAPRGDHLAFFNGFKWYQLRQGLFSGSGDFKVRANENRIKVTFRHTTIKVELTTPSTGEYSWCELPQGYTGPFTVMATGVPVPCWLNSGEWTCRADVDCRDMIGVPGGGVPRYDNIVLNGGVCDATPGACCFDNTSCLENQTCGDCLSLGGHCGDPGSTCANTACCPPMVADHDMDDDVDVEDFGWFQTCLSTGAYVPPPTVPCQCTDLDGDGDVDQTDVEKFVSCVTGPGMPLNASCLN